MLRFRTTHQFERDYRRILKRGHDENRIVTVMTKIICQERLEAKYKDHGLKGKYAGRRECHIEPDWLLIYKKTSGEIIFERTGTHSDLFE